MPTALERMIWGFGERINTGRPFDSPYGRIGSVICGKYMPMLRMAHVRQERRALLRPPPPMTEIRGCCPCDTWLWKGAALC